MEILRGGGGRIKMHYWGGEQKRNLRGEVRGGGGGEHMQYWETSIRKQISVLGE